ncbi:MAG: hypothetical protein IKY12_04115, partial [Clostridia bacterium]|nr:hypothetical protein [Clostridia bacterium]
MMDENRNNEEMSVDELLERLKASLQEEDEKNESAPVKEEDDEIKKAVAAAIGESVEDEPIAVQEAEEPVTEVALDEEETEVLTAFVGDDDLSAPASEDVQSVFEAADEEADFEVAEAIEEESAVEDETAAEDVAESVSAHINEEDIFAAWGINREDMQKTQTIDMSSVNEEYVAPVADSVKSYRIARVENRSEYLERKQTEAQKSKTDYDGMDYSLIKQALGMEKPNEDDNNFTMFDVEEPTVTKTIDGPHAEFTYQRQSGDISKDYAKYTRSSLVKLIATAVFAVLLFAVECLPAFGIGVPSFVDVNRLPVVFSMVTLQLAWLCGAVSYKEIANGFLSMLGFKFTSGSLLAIATAVATVCGVVNCALGSEGQTYYFTVAFLSLIIRVFDYLDIRRETFSFEIASSTQSKKYVAVTVPTDEAQGIE